MAKGKPPFPFENSKFDKDTKKAPEGSKADMARDKKQAAAAGYPPSPSFSRGGKIAGSKGGQKSFRR